MVSAESLRAAIIDTVRLMREEGLVRGTAGNVSAREPGGPSFWITPSGVDYTTMTTEDLVQVDLAGNRLGGRLTPSSDTMSHAAIYRRRGEVGAVVHTHSTYATVFAVVRREVPALLVEAAGYLGGAVPVIEYVPPANPEVGEQVAAGLGRHRAVLLPNHGVIATGESVESAFTAALLVEQSAHIAYLASLLGMPEPLPQGEVERMHRFLHEEYGQRRSPPTSGQRLPSAAE
jgi:L-ribulose-5-phosphate 4-epimerase